MHGVQLMEWNALQTMHPASWSLSGISCVCHNALSSIEDLAVATFAHIGAVLAAACNRLGYMLGEGKMSL